MKEQPTDKQLELQRERLRQDLRSMHSLVSDLCLQNSQKKISEILAVRIQSNNRQLYTLRVEYDQYCAILDGKYPAAINEELQRMKNQRQLLRKEIVELNKTVNTQVKEFTGQEGYLKEEFKLKSELESHRQKNLVRLEEMEKKNKQLANLKRLMAGLSEREVHIPPIEEGPSLSELKQLQETYTKLQEKRAKLQQELSRKNKLKSGELNKKLSKLDEIDLLTNDFETMEDYLSEKIVETQQELQELRKKREERHSYRGDEMGALVMPRLNRVRTEVAGPVDPKQRVWKTSSLLEEEYPNQYKDLFFQPKKAHLQSQQLKSAGLNRRSLGQRVRLGFNE